MANGISKKMEEYLARQRALGYEPSLDGVDEEDLDYVPSWSLQNPDRQQSPPLGREYRPVDRGFAERIFKMFARPFDPKWQMPDLDGPEYSQPPQPRPRTAPGGIQPLPYGPEQGEISDLVDRGYYDPNKAVRTLEYRFGNDDKNNGVMLLNATSDGQSGGKLPEGTLITSNDAGANLNSISKARNIPDVTDRLHALMAEYEEKYKDIKDTYLPTRYKIFLDLVKDHGILDIKRQPGWDSPQFVYTGEVVNNDVPGNILYGYVGKHFGIPDTVLYAAAGGNQMTNDARGLLEEGNPLHVLKGFNLDSFGDDPRDTTRIRQGIGVWNKKYIPKPLVYGD